MLIAVVTAHLLWRHSYYGEWLPNTYYLKVSGWPLSWRIGPGLLHSALTIAGTALVLLFSMLSVGLTLRTERLLPLAVFAGALAYQTYVGGDAWYRDRLAIPGVLPILVLAADGIVRVCRWRGSPFQSAAFITALTALCALNLNIRYLRELLLQRPYMTRYNEMNIQHVLALDRISDARATVVVSFAGVVPYYSRRRCFDELGKCDRHIARLPVPAGLERQRAGHIKEDWPYILNVCHPDLVLHAYPVMTSFLSHHRPVGVQVDGHERVICVRTDSPLVHGGRPMTWEEASANIDEFYNGPDSR